MMNAKLKPWCVVMAAALFFFYEFIQMNMTGSLAPYIMASFSMDATHLGYLSATYFYSTVLFLLPAGQLLDRFSTRAIILIALMFCITGTFFFAITSSYTVAQGCRFFTGIGSAFCFLSCIRLASRWLLPQQMAVASGLVVTMAMLGGAVAQTPLTLLIQVLGNWRDAIKVDALLGIIFWLIIFFTVKDYPDENKHQQIKDKTAIQLLGYWKALRASYAHIRNWVCGFYTCFVNLPIFLMGGGGFGALYLTQVKHMPALQATFPPSLIFLGTVFGSPFAGWLSDKLGRRKLPMQLGAFFSALFILGIMFLDGSVFFYAILFFLLGFISSSQVISYPMVSEMNPKFLTATSVSVVSFTTLSGGAVFQPLFGYLMDNAGHDHITHQIHVYTADAYRMAMFIMPVTLAIAFTLTFFLRETYGHASG